MRLDILEHAPEGHQAVSALDRSVRPFLDHELFELVRLRASQINGCAFCVDMHATDLERSGVPTRRIYAVSAWRETDYFSERERAALALTEAVTRIEHGVPDDVWDAAAAVFTEQELANLVIAIATINVWNRLAVTAHKAPPPLD